MFRGRRSLSVICRSKVARFTNTSIRVYHSRLPDTSGGKEVRVLYDVLYDVLHVLYDALYVAYYSYSYWPTLVLLDNADEQQPTSMVTPLPVPAKMTYPRAGNIPIAGL
eukprot:2906449-Pyramimonas_sp.AAC.1